MLAFSPDAKMIPAYFFSVSKAFLIPEVWTEEMKLFALHIHSIKLWFVYSFTFWPGSGSANLCGFRSGPGKNMRNRIRNTDEVWEKKKIFKCRNVCKLHLTSESCYHCSICLKIIARSYVYTIIKHPICLQYFFCTNIVTFCQKYNWYSIDTFRANVALLIMPEQREMLMCKRFVSSSISYFLSNNYRRLNGIVYWFI